MWKMVTTWVVFVWQQHRSVAGVQYMLVVDRERLQQNVFFISILYIFRRRIYPYGNAQCFKAHECEHIYVHIHLQTCTHRHLILCFTFPEGAWIKQEYRDLLRSSERHRVYWQISAAVVVCSCHNLHVWTYRISSLLDAVCSENSYCIANLSEQTCTHVQTPICTHICSLHFYRTQEFLT